MSLFASIGSNKPTAENLSALEKEKYRLEQASTIQTPEAPAND
jgi:hypothetical protein